MRQQVQKFIQINEARAQLARSLVVAYDVRNYCYYYVVGRELSCLRERLLYY